MKLRDWLEREGITFAEMGLRIECTGEAVRRYAGGERIPGREAMARIVRETSGEVTANDFFDIDLAPSEDGLSREPGSPSPDTGDEFIPEAAE